MTSSANSTAKAAPATAVTEPVDASQAPATLQAENAQLKQQLDWFKRQLFGPKSEKRSFDDPQQLGLGELFNARPDSQAKVPKQTINYERGKGAKQRGEDCVNGSGPRFDDTVPVNTITCPVF